MTQSIRSLSPGGSQGLGWSGLRRGFLVIAGLLLALVAFTTLDSFFGYAMFRINADEVGVKFRASQAYKVVGPGVWTELGLWEDIKPVRISGLPFKVVDPEVLTKDQQRLGIEIAGTVHRPGIDKEDVMLSNWANYSTFYTNDLALVGDDKSSGGLIQRLGQQAGKVCVGDLQFSQAVVGSAHDVLRECIDTELDKLAKGYGLEVRNVVVPNIVLGETVQTKLDDITNAKFATLEAQQNELKAKAEAAHELAVEQGKILVEQGRVQEKAKQDATTASLNKQALDAQNSVIDAQKRNDLLSAEKELEVAKVRRAVAEENARAELAPELAKAGVYAQNPIYVDFLKAQAWSSAYSKMDKVILPPNVNPFMFIGGDNAPTVTVPISPTVTTK